MLTTSATVARGPVPVLRVLGHSFATGFGLVVAEPKGLIARAWFYAVVTAVLASMWRIAIIANDDGAGAATVAGYSAVAIFWYIAAAEAALIPVPSNLIEQVVRPIVDESIEAWFSRPIFAGLPTLMFRFGQVLPISLACAGTGTALSLLLAGPPPNLIALALALPALCLAVLLSITIQYTFAALAFWLGDISGMWLVYHRAVFILGGLIIPLETLPSWLEPIARALPFMATVYVPGRLAAGYLEPMLIVRQIFWLTVFITAAAVIFRRGEEHMCRRGVR